MIILLSIMKFKISPLICLFGVLRHFQHCTGHITTGSWKGRGNQYIEFARVVYCKLPTNGKQLPAFPLEPVRGSNPGLRGGRRECYHSATMAPNIPTETDYTVICGDFNIVLDPSKDTDNYKSINNPKGHTAVLNMM